MFTYEIVSPESLASRGKAKMIVLSAAEGRLGLLENHAPIVSTLDPGIVSIYSDANTINAELFVSGGFVSMIDNMCSILVDEVLTLTELTHDYVENRFKRAEDAVLLAQTAHDKVQARKQCKISQVMRALRSTHQI
ncbi:MAG: ATP synthase F1 subunit epsilon [Alphaproteobacteria bacterium]|nr:ATP synthase F1 subunit epsilon [Alphaproteobacteria bacterium]OJV45512.1 MAG: ATP synthase F1 subunit epsilon [Alphaproteobacteria bacterium 43-37]